MFIKETMYIVCSNLALVTHNLSRYPWEYLIKNTMSSTPGYKLNLKYTLSESDVDTLSCCVWSVNRISDYKPTIVYQADGLRTKQLAIK